MAKLEIDGRGIEILNRHQLFWAAGSKTGYVYCYRDTDMGAKSPALEAAE